MTNKSNKRKFLATTLTATMVAAAVAPVAGAAAAEAGPFPDVPADHAYAGVITDMVNAGIVKGEPDGSFHLGGKITRAEAAQMVAGLLDLKVGEQANNTNFEDVKSDAWYTGAINSLVAEGIVAGKTSTLFAPGADITRGELAQLLVVAYGLEDVNVDDVELPFTDVDEKAWFADPIKKLYSAGLIDGQTATKFGPKDDMKRGDFAWLAANVDYELGNKLPKPDDVVKPIESVSAINGTITVKFNQNPETTPTAADFKVSRTINGGTASTVAPTVSYDEATKTATLSVATVNQTTEAQTVKYAVEYDGETYDASFVVAAPTAPAQTVEAVSIAANQVKVYFSQPVNNTTATNVANYANRALVTDSGILPTRVTLNTTAEGSYAANQVATLTFSAAVADRLTVSNVTTLAGATIPTETFTGITTVTDVTDPTITVDLLTADGINDISTGNVQSGTELALTATVEDPDASGEVTFVTGAEYRLEKPDGSFTAWTKLDANDAPYNEATEVVKGKISTSGFGVGTYNVELRATDAAGNTGVLAPATSFVVIPASPDLTAPTVSPIAVGDTNFTYAAVTTGTAQQGAFTVRVTGSATDGTTPAGVAAVQKVEHRLLQVNTITGATTVVQGWTSARATDGAFGGTTEAFNFVTPELTEGTTYLIQTRATDAAGNTSPVVPALVDNTSVPDSISNAISTAFTPPAGVTMPTGAFTVIEDNTAPTLLADPAITTNLAPGNRERTIEITGQANDVAGAPLFTNAISNINKVEYAVYRDNGNGTRTLVQNYSDQGVALDPATIAGTARGYTINYTLPAVDGTYEIDVVATDGAGNKSAVRTTAKYILDVNAPTAKIVPNTATPATNDFVVTFSEAVTPVVAADFILTDLVGGTVAGGTATNVTPVTSATPNTQYVVTFDADVLAANNVIKIVNLTDAALNPITGTYRVTSADLDQ